MNPNKRAYVSSRFCLELEGVVVGWLYTAEGGQATTEVVQERMAVGYPVFKHPGNVKIEDISVTFGSTMSPDFYKWLKTSIDYRHERRHGAVISANYDYKEVTRQTFSNALITEISFPALDAASKEPCRMGIKIGAEQCATTFQSAGRAITPANIKSDQKKWMAANFRLAIDGLPCKQASKVEAITIKQNIVDNSVGERLIFDKEPAQIEFSNVVVTIPEIEAADWYKWHEDFVVKGNSKRSNEKNGSLEFLTSDMSPLFTLGFTHLGPVKYTPDKLDSASEKLRMVKFEMYCEQMKFEY